MKPYIIIAIAFFMMAGPVQAQHVNLGIKGGLNASTLQGNNSGGYTPKIGLNFGLLGHIHKGKQFALQPEILYSMQGTQYKSGGKDVFLNLSYVNIPLLFQYMFDNGFRLEAGPQVGILASAKSKVGNSSSNENAKFKSTDLGLAAGMSYVKPSTGYGYNIRYNHGLTNINEGNGNAFNRGLQVGLFYLFDHR